MYTLCIGLIYRNILNHQYIVAKSFTAKFLKWCRFFCFTVPTLILFREQGHGFLQCQCSRNVHISSSTDINVQRGLSCFWHPVVEKQQDIVSLLKEITVHSRHCSAWQQYCGLMTGFLAFWGNGIRWNSADIWEICCSFKKKKSAVQASQQYEVQRYNLAELKSHEIKSLIFVFCSFNHSRNPQFVGLELKQVWAKVHVILF